MRKNLTIFLGILAVLLGLKVFDAIISYANSRECAYFVGAMISFAVTFRYFSIKCDNMERIIRNRTNKPERKFIKVKIVE